jgi:hypothetical protein
MKLEIKSELLSHEVISCSEDAIEINFRGELTGHGDVVLVMRRRVMVVAA